MGDRGGWKRDGTFRKKYSEAQTNRNNSTYTLRGKEMSLQKTLRKLADNNKTLGSGNLLTIIDIPEETVEDCRDKLMMYHPDLGEEELEARVIVDARNEWLAANTVDFYNEVALLYGIVEDFHQRSCDQVAYVKLKEEFSEYSPRFPAFGNGFPTGFQYRLKTSKKDDGNVSGAEYVSLSMIWLEDQIDNSQIFPETAEDPFPPKFEQNYISEMFKRMFRIFAIIYAVCWPVVVASEAEAHVNTCFKHFYFFTKRFELMKKKGDRAVFTKTKVKTIMDLDQLDIEYAKCLEEISKSKK